MENSRLHSQEPSFRPEPLNQEPRWAIVTYRISLVSGPGGVINSNAHTAILLPGPGGGGEQLSLLQDNLGVRMGAPPRHGAPWTGERLAQTAPWEASGACSWRGQFQVKARSRHLCVCVTHVCTGLGAV